MSDVKQFQNEHRFLSNFAYVDVVFEGVTYRSVEAAYQAAKTLDPELRKPFMYAMSYQAKRMGKLLDVRPDWDDVKESIMCDLLRQKFYNNPYHKNGLLATGDGYLEEGNVWGDRYWGVDLQTGEGENRLGKILMEIRSELETIKFNEQGYVK